MFVRGSKATQVAYQVLSSLAEPESANCYRGQGDGVSGCRADNIIEQAGNCVVLRGVAGAMY